MNIASYLLFTPEFCGKLIDLGYRDGMAQREALSCFLYKESDDSCFDTDNGVQP